MNRFLSISVFALLSLPVVSSRAQSLQTGAADSAAKIKPVVKPQVIKPKKPKPITKEFSVGVRLNTDGWSVFADKGWLLSDDEKTIDKFFNVKLAQVEITEHKNPREIKVTNTNGTVAFNDKPKPYVYGKMNNFYALKLGYGKRRMIAGKPESGTVSIHWVYMGGLSIGLLKPYYIDAYVPQDNPPNTFVKKSIKYSDEPQDSFLDQRYIVGSSGWSKGLGETKIVPGLQGKTGLHFDFAANTRTKLALEVGLSGELYTKKIELLAGQKAFPYLFNGYVSIQFGKRW